ncbi:MAG: HIT family protein [Lachnospira sp.]
MKKDDCIFCKLANGVIPTNSLYEDDVVKVIFDASPAADGHVLVIPKEHFDNLYSMDDDTAAHVIKVAKKIAKAMNDVLDIDGLNLVQNNGEAAGQTVFHFHLHIIPRKKGDTVNVGWVPKEASQETIEAIKDKVIPLLGGKE